MKRLLVSMSLFVALLSARAATCLPYGPRFVLFQMGIEDSYLLYPQLDWKLYVGDFVGLIYGDILLKGPDNSFNLAIQIGYDDPDLPRYDTPEKLRAELRKLTAGLYRDSWERSQGIPHDDLFREFAPAGRFGFAARFSARRWVGKTPPKDDPEGKYATCGFFRSGQYSVMYFQLWCNSVDDAEYYKLLDYIAALAIPEVGELKWRVFHGKAAARVASAELARRFPEEVLRPLRPYVVRLDGNKWIVCGTPWRATPENRKAGSSAPRGVKAIIDGPSGKVVEAGRLPSSAGKGTEQNRDRK